MALGISLVTGGTVNIVLIVAIFISNFPEGLASTVGMKTNGKSNEQLIILWSIAVFISTMSAVDDEMRMMIIYVKLKYNSFTISEKYRFKYLKPYSFLYSINFTFIIYKLISCRFFKVIRQTIFLIWCSKL